MPADPRIRPEQTNPQIRTLTRIAYLEKQDSSARLLGETSSILPDSPISGQIISYQSASMASGGVRWFLQYNAESASPYKWEFVGGSPLLDREDSSYTAVTGSYTYSSDLLVTVPLDGEYVCRWGATALNPGTNIAGIGFLDCTIGTSGASDTPAVVYAFAASTATLAAGVSGAKTLNPAAGNTIRQAYREVGTDVEFSRRWLEVTPVRVG